MEFRPHSENSQKNTTQHVEALSFNVSLKLLLNLVATIRTHLLHYRNIPISKLNHIHKIRGIISLFNPNGREVDCRYS